ncbi:uncharacterized protein LOC128208916 [Mya arenaria]|uniref:uncharacterized protein LOC128208916 n=1 Tax=Mya arenaria TaxID=6604 RepID=UPI0022E87222|nr:uncharacterized protein LOC128208916 [Mya arenaria]
MSEKQEVTPEFVTYIKERDAALKEAADARAELRETQSRLYDALQLIESLEKKTGEGKKTSKKSVATKKKTDKPNGLATKTSTSLASSGVSSARTSAPVSARTDGRLYHPPIDAVDPSADSKEYYWKIAEKFSQLPMFTILDAERKFIKADADGSGTIDIDEMDRVLSESVGMFTPKQLADIMAEMDTDKSGTLDFMEVLTVINRLVSHRKTNLPQSMQQNYSKTCSIQ